jgi:uncharacterized protein YcnI
MHWSLGRTTRGTRMAATLMVVVAVAVAGIGVPAAGAHVTVHPGTEKNGASDVLLTFAVPNEEDSASTTKLELTLPAATPLLGVRAQAMAGWTITVETAKLAKPVTTDDGTITEAASKVTWTANDAADAVSPGEFGAFTLLVGTLPTKGSRAVFKAVQTYSDGTVVSWIEPVVKGTPAPEHPAPVLRLARHA